MKVQIKSLREPLETVFARRGAKPLGALVTWARAGSTFLTGVALFMDTKGKPRRSVDYGSVQLEEQWLPLGTAISMLDATVFGRNAKRRFDFGNFHESHWLERRLPDAFENLSGWPEWVIAARHADNAVQAPQGPAVGHGLPPFETVSRAVENWTLGMERQGGGDAAHLREFLIVVSDTRGALKSVKWAGSKLSGTIHTLSEHAELELQVVLDTESGKRMLDPIRPVPAAFIWDTPKDARLADVYLVHASKDLMGHVRVTPGAEVSAEALALTVAEQARRDLLDWESENVEFKPFIDRKDAKESEVIESAVAFANTNGGRIYVGVGKDREPEAEKALKRVLQSDRPEALTDYMKHLDEVIRERVKPVPFIKVESVHLLGRQVIVITVETGRDKPYSTVPGNDVFIRSGAANRRPDPKAELPRLYESTGIPFPAVHPWSRNPY